MSYIQRELDRVQAVLHTEGPDKNAQLYAVQQALSWALEPHGFKSPYDLVTGTPGGSGDCSEPRHPPQS